MPNVTSGDMMNISYEGSFIMKQEIYTISEFAKYTGVSVRTLHYYDAKNILKPKRDESTGHRIYEKGDLIQLHKIMTLKFLGLTLDHISEYMHHDTFDLSFLDTLKMQETKLLNDREKIDTALEAIHRTRNLLENEKTVDHAILVSLLAGMQHEKRQQKLTEAVVRDEVMESMFPSQLKDKMEFETVLLNFYKTAKSLYGKPLEDPEVKKMLDDFYSAILEVFDMETLEDLAGIYKVDFENQEDLERIEKYLDEIDRISPVPLTEEEERWLHEITADYDGFTFKQER